MNPEENRADFVLRLFDAYYNRVYAFTRRCTTTDVAEDVTQEVFVRLLQHPRLEQLDLSVSYLIKVAHNLLRRRHARGSRLRELLDTAVRDELVQRHGRPEQPRRDHTPQGYDSIDLEQAMSGLTNDEQQALKLIVQEGCSYQHAANALGVTVTTINNWKHRGLSKLRKIAEQGERTKLERLPATA
ncbi:MAG: RNA polymerase sigma factor [Planctomycetota bacterium]|nr:RNA polymerase sigma factor [Planctomycetota bacterium]